MGEVKVKTLKVKNHIYMKQRLLILQSLFFLAAATAMAQIIVGQTYRITPVADTGKVLFPENASLDAATSVVIWTQTHVPAEQWTVGERGEYLTLRNVYSGKYLSLSSTSTGAVIRQNASATSMSRWNIETVDEAAGIYRLTAYTGTKSLDAGTLQEGTVPTLAVKDESSQGQLWQFTPVQPQTDFTQEMQSQMIDDYLSAFLERFGSRRATFIRGSWGESEQLEVLLDAYEGTGNEDYLTYAKAVYSYFNQNVGSDWLKLVYTDAFKWYGHDFNDDVMWQVIATARLGWLTGTKSYISAAKRNFDAIWDRAYIPFTGLMRWAESSGDPYGTNSCIAGPTEVAACYLAMSGCGEEYYEKARDLYAAQRYRLTDMSTGQVWDACVWNPQTQNIKSYNKWASTYNQGTFLGAACMLYQHYGDQQYLSDALKIMEYTVKNLCDRNGIINVCQVNDGDLCGFKGILMRYVHLLVRDLKADNYKEWICKNALHAYNNRSPRGLTTSKWLTKTTDDVATNAFSCSTAAAAAAAAIIDTDTGIHDLDSEPTTQHNWIAPSSSSTPFPFAYDLMGRRALRHGTRFQFQKH